MGYNMNIHEKMVKELYDKKSLNAFIYLIEHGRELEFEYNSKECFISRDNSKSSVSIWVNKEEQAFDNMEDLIRKAKIDGVLFEDVWKIIQLGILY